MRAWPLAALLLTTSPAARAGVDLSDQLPAACSDQGGIRACHAFAALVLVHAAAKRNMIELAPLSEADLFTRVALAENGFEVSKLNERVAEIEQIESGYAERDLAFVLGEGVAYEKSASWERFVDAYRAYMREINIECVETAIAKGETADQCMKKNGTAAKFIERIKSERDAREKRFLGDADLLAAERKEVQGKLSRFKLQSKSKDKGDFVAAGPREISDPGVCREKGRKQTELLVEKLGEKLPVLVCFDMENLPAWDRDLGKKDPKKPRHCAVVYRWDRSGEGQAARVVFTLRNSWGYRLTPPRFNPLTRGLEMTALEPNTHPISEDHACAINGAYWLIP